MATGDYAKAHKLGKKDYQNRMLRGQKPTLQVLDEIVHDQEKLFQHLNTIENAENVFSSVTACDPQIHRLSRSHKIQFL